LEGEEDLEDPAVIEAVCRYFAFVDPSALWEETYSSHHQVLWTSHRHPGKVCKSLLSGVKLSMLETGGNTCGLTRV
jgi:hypothetical protein